MYIIGIAGGSGSGKTTFAKKVCRHVTRDICLLHMDSYYLPIPSKELYTERGRPNFDHPRAFDWPLLRKHLQMLKEGKSIKAPIYDFKSSMRTDNYEVVGPSSIVIFEGIFTLFDAEIRDMLDIRSFLHVDSDIRFARRLDRDVQERGRRLQDVIDQYYDTVRPMYQQFLEPQQQYADFIVGEETDVAASILSAKVQELIDNKDNPKYNPALQRDHLQTKESLGLHEH